VRYREFVTFHEKEAKREEVWRRRCVGGRDRDASIARSRCSREQWCLVDTGARDLRSARQHRQSITNHNHDYTR